MRTIEYVWVNTTDFSAVTYGYTLEELNEKIVRSKERIEETKQSYRNHAIDYPNNAEMWQGYLDRLESAEYEIMTFDEYWKRHDQYYCDMPVKEISEERYDEMLNILPPMCWCTIDGVTMFCMSEMLSGNITAQYGKCDGKFYCKNVDVYNKETWLHKVINK